MVRAVTRVHWSIDHVPTDLHWPKGRVPIELFVMIAELMPDRKDIGAMRLVNREFNSKLICYFSQQLVIHIGSELTPRVGSGLTSPGDSAFVDVTDHVLNSAIFRSFGPSIRRLALVLNLNESDIASPPIAPALQLHVAPWGIYRWPAPLEDDPNSLLERTITSMENPQGIFRMMTIATDVRELALSCEGGLGYLQGPDVNPLQPPGPPPIFGDGSVVRATDDLALKVRHKKPYMQEVMERQLAAARVDPSVSVVEMLDQLVSTEGSTLQELTREERQRAALPMSRYESRKIRPPVRNDKIRLQPDQLTETQRRFLHQHISAQQALINSFRLAMVDHGDSFTRLTKINISQLPSYHVPLMCVDSFWSKLPALNEVVLGIVPDWREMIPKSEFDIEVRQVYPTDAMEKVFELLQNHIGVQPNIKRLHFEWICGGEFAAGYVQRNWYVLPAPFLKNHRMVVDSSMENLLILPHITHLSLKNCWFVPHVFYRIMRTMSETNVLESLELETVSLSGPAIFRHIMPDRDFGSGPVLQETGPLILGQPLDMSWAHVIDMLTPGQTIRERAHAQKPGTDQPPLIIKKTLKLRRIVFKSCGYVKVPDPRFISNRRFVVQRLPPGQHRALAERIRIRRAARVVDHDDKMDEVLPYLQVSTDRHLASIVPAMDQHEITAMQTVFGFHLGWLDTYGEAFIKAAQRDGVQSPGQGRFSGTIEGDPATPDPGENAASYEYDTSDFDVAYPDEHMLPELLSCLELPFGYHSEDDHDTSAQPEVSPI
ncbi:hypothetical protein GGR54DRAFT_384176 [Hypoxylon sp. NC1633]|nr:hypothetical protein GGR54DRAFT_384176 [Hypoxylon sp. NC1633]